MGITSFLKKDKIKYGYNLHNKIKDSNLNIKFEEIYETEITNTMNNIIKIHNIFLKYNSIQKNNINDLKDLNLNKFIYMREMQEINIPQQADIVDTEGSNKRIILNENDKNEKSKANISEDNKNEQNNSLLEEEKVSIKEQKLEKFERFGFSAIEWGGMTY